MPVRGSGVLLHISSLPSVHGIGDLGPEAYTFVDHLKNAAQSFWQVLPLNPTTPGNCNSPYLSSSSAAGNTLLISLEKLAAVGLLSQKDISEGAFSAGWVDYPAVTRFKIPLLEKAFAVYSKQKDTGSFEQFCSAHKCWLDDYALFTALKLRFNGTHWNSWPRELKYRYPEALARAILECNEDILREKWYQFIFYSQWEELKRYCHKNAVRIIGDIPIYVGYDSVDVWCHPDHFKLDEHLTPIAVSGVPPDYFSTTGQLWNNPVYDWSVLKKAGFTWWNERMKAMFGRFDIVRIDHFRGLVQYWEVPAGEKTAINGSWQPVPTRELFDTMLRHFPDFPVIAEDLGIITDDVRAEMEYYRLPGMKVLLFAFGDADPFHPYLPHMYRNNCIVYTGTHDNNTIRGWFENEAGNDGRERLFQYAGSHDRSVETAVWAMVRLAQSSVADIAVVPLQDLLVLDASARMNRPSIAEGNWEWRVTGEQMARFPTQTLHEMAVLFGRLPSH